MFPFCPPSRRRACSSLTESSLWLRLRGRSSSLFNSRTSWTSGGNSCRVFCSTWEVQQQEKIKRKQQTCRAHWTSLYLSVPLYQHQNCLVSLIWAQFSEHEWYYLAPWRCSWEQVDASLKAEQHNILSVSSSSLAAVCSVRLLTSCTSRLGRDSWHWSVQNILSFSSCPEHEAWWELERITAVGSSLHVEVWSATWISSAADHTETKHVACRNFVFWWWAVPAVSWSLDILNSSQLLPSAVCDCLVAHAAFPFLSVFQASVSLLFLHRPVLVDLDTFLLSRRPQIQNLLHHYMYFSWINWSRDVWIDSDISLLMLMLSWRSLLEFVSFECRDWLLVSVYIIFSELVDVLIVLVMNSFPEHTITK